MEAEILAVKGKRTGLGTRMWLKILRQNISQFARRAKGIYFIYTYFLRCLLLVPCMSGGRFLEQGGGCIFSGDTRDSRERQV